MIGAFAKAGCVLKDDVYLKRAVKAAAFVKKYLWNEEKGKLTRSCYKGDDGEIVQLYAMVFFNFKCLAIIFCKFFSLIHMVYPFL